jgi:hypothetical protein
LLLVANLVMVYSSRKEGFASYYLDNGAGVGKDYKKIGAFDDLTVQSDEGSWRYPAFATKMMGPEFVPGPDSLFIFRDNIASPDCCPSGFSTDTGCVCATHQQSNYINTRGGNRTVDDGV